MNIISHCIQLYYHKCDQVVYTFISSVDYLYKYKSKSFVWSFLFTKSKGKDQFDQMVVTVNYGRGHLQELFKQDFTIDVGCANWKDGNDGSFDCTREIQLSIMGTGVAENAEKTLLDSQICRVSQWTFLLPVLCHPNLQTGIHRPDQECTAHWIHDSYDHPLPGVRNCQ